MPTEDQQDEQPVRQSPRTAVLQTSVAPSLDKHRITWPETKEIQTRLQRHVKVTLRRQGRCIGTRQTEQQVQQVFTMMQTVSERRRVICNWKSRIVLNCGIRVMPKVFHDHASGAQHMYCIPVTDAVQYFESAGTSKIFETKFESGA